MFYWACCSKVVCLVSNKDKTLNTFCAPYKVLNILSNEGCIGSDDYNILPLVQEGLCRIARQQILPIFLCVRRYDVLEIEMLYLIFPLQS